MLPHVAVVGTRAEVLDQLTAFVDAGVRHVIFTPCPRDDGDTLVRELVDDVVPDAPPAVGL